MGNNLRSVLVLLAVTAVILAVTAIPWILHGTWAPFVGTALAFAVAWFAAGVAGLAGRCRD